MSGHRETLREREMAYNRSRNADQARCRRWVKLRRTQCKQVSSELPLIADIAQYSRLKSANKRLVHRSTQLLYSITSSATARRLGGNSRLSARAVFKFTSISKRIGCSTGSSDGLAPFRILSTYPAARGYCASVLVA